MGFNITGYVIRPARVASGNSQDTNEAVSGVDRDHILPDERGVPNEVTLESLGYEVRPSGPVEPYADMYRAAVLEKPASQQGTEQYCVFAATTGSLSTVASDEMAIVADGASANAIAGTLEVVDERALLGPYFDGTLDFYLRDLGQRDISSGVSISILRGDIGLPVITLAVSTLDPTIGKVEVNDPGDALGGGYSVERGDRLFASAYVLASPTFWWSRNDAARTRFGWDGLNNRWLPLKGGGALVVGIVKPDEGYKLVPPPSRFVVGDTLPYDPADADSYALVRVGLYSDTDSPPLNILVVTDTTAEGGWNGASADAILGVTSGVLVLNPGDGQFTKTQSGRTLWYNPESNLTGADGDLGAVVDFPSGSNQGFPSLSPIPETTERPFLRIGSRRYLTPIAVDQDVEDVPAGLTGLPSPAAVSTGEVYWSKTTGKIVLSSADILRCLPGDLTYDITYLGARLYFDGTSMSTQPLPLKAPVAALNAAGEPLDGGQAVIESGDIYLPRAVCLPPPGVSGVRWEEDGSGDTPNISVSPQTRPNGSGLVRRISGGGTARKYGDTFFFSKDYAYENLGVEEYEEDLPLFKFKVPKNRVDIARMVAAPQPASHSDTSRTQFRRRPVQGEPLYFRQAEVILSVYADQARISSRFAGPYTLDGNETLRFALDGTEYTWKANVLNTTGIAADYTADQVMASLIADALVPSWGVGVLRGRLHLQSEFLNTGNLEIGWNAPQTDLTGHAALGFLPGWRVDVSGTVFRWLPDNGSYLGVFRSPVNMDRTDDTPDIRSRSRLTDSVLMESIPANPYLNLNPPPLLDIPGYTTTSHFQVVLGLLLINLENYQTSLDVGVIYDWANRRFGWVSKGTTTGKQVPYSSFTLGLDHTGVYPETVSPTAMQDSSFGLNLRRATDASGGTLPFEYPDGEYIDFLMPSGGNPGQALLVTPQGIEVAAGGRGTFTSGIAAFFDVNVSDQTALYDAVEVGYLLHILGGDGEGIYTITFKGTSVSPATFTVSPTFAATESSAQWRIYEAKTRDEVDPTLLADVQQVPTNHFPDEPFKIRALTLAGTVGSALNAVVVDAIASERIVSLRFGLEATSPQAAPVYLVRGVNLGAVTASGLMLPSLTDPHVTNSDSPTGVAYFQIRVGAQTFTTDPGGNMTLNQGTVASTGIDVNTISGGITVGADVVSDLGGSSVYYDQSFLAPADLAAAACEIDPASGDINLSADALSTHDGVTAYFVEQMVTVNNLDVVTSPLNGSLLFNKPLRAMQIVEVNYFRADTNGDKKLDGEGLPIEITEFLPLIVTLEQATFVSKIEWLFNPTGRTVSGVIKKFIWIGTDLMNFAGVADADAIDNVITISDVTAAKLDTSSETVVKINYGVLEAFGGEQAYTVSSPPVYRKPFWINQDSSTFTLETDRTADFRAALLMMLGSTPLYIDSSVYDASTDLTTVTIFPPPHTEVGSRAVGRDKGLNLSDFLVSVSRGGEPGFMPLLDTDAAAGTPLLEVDRGQLSVSFYGDVRGYTKTNHLLEIGGYPYVIVGSKMSDDGYNTVVEMATPAYKAHDNSEEVRVSVRPVYAPSPVDFKGIAPFVPSEEYALFLMGRKDGSGTALPGKVLIEGMDYMPDEDTGDVLFQTPSQGPLQPGEYLHFRYTRATAVSPVAQDGALLYPVYSGRYLHLSTPSIDNRLLGSALKAEYTYRSQDSFFFSVQTLEDYLGEVSVVSANQGVVPISGGATFFSAGSSDLSKRGSYGLRGGAQNASDLDRAARVFVEFFTGVTVAFEQVLEAIDGRIIGDRDGKFRFFIGHDKRYAPPGYEDEITGALNQRLIWREIIDTWAPPQFAADGGYFRTKDYVYAPLTALADATGDRPGETTGLTPDPYGFWLFTKMQRMVVKNDMDDRMLIALGKAKFEVTMAGGLPFPVLRFKGNYDDMWESHRFSRLYPERTNHFSRLVPGISADSATMYEGFYTPGRDILLPGPEPGEESMQKVKTTGSTTGTVSNPALGEIANIVTVEVRDRRPRARIWAYYPEGSAELDTALGVTTVGIATLVATPLTLGEFPINAVTGFPDTSQLVSEGGALDDLLSGNVELATPKFEVGNTLNYGKPDGLTYSLKNNDGFTVLVLSIQGGCVITLGMLPAAAPVEPIDPALITALNGNEIFVDADLSTRLGSVTSSEDGILGYADTVYGGPAAPDVSAGVDPPTTPEMAAIVKALPDYRLGFDLRVRRRSSEFVDFTLPTQEDNFFLPLQDILGQNPPAPLSCVEGAVGFINTDSEPLELPCLLGEDKDDSGDNQIPFLKGYPNELAVLGQVAPLLEGIYLDTTFTVPYTPPWYTAASEQRFKAVYPDEDFIGDGSLHEEAAWRGYPQNPATLYTDQSLQRSTDEGNGDNTGLGDLRPFDLLLVQTNQDQIPAGMTGILSVGAVERQVPWGTPLAATPGTIEPPRFVTPCKEGGLHRYTLAGFAGWVGEREDPGFGIRQPLASLAVGAGIWDTQLRFDTETGVTSLPDVFAVLPLAADAPAWNVFTIRFYDPDPLLVGDAFIGALVFRRQQVGQDLYIYKHSSGVTYKIPINSVVPTTPASSVISFQYDTTASGNLSFEDLLGITIDTAYDFRLDLDTYGSAEAGLLMNDATFVGAATGSTTCRIEQDRLSFVEKVDMTVAKDRNYGPANNPTGGGLEAALNVWEITSNGVGLTVNAAAEINGGLYLTFLNRLYPLGTAAPTTEYVGTWDGTDGTLRAMGWEGHSNTSLVAPGTGEIEGIVVSAVPSSDLMASSIGVISVSTYNFWDGDSSLSPLKATEAASLELEGNRNYLTNPTFVTGDITDIESGDICVIPTWSQTLAEQLGGAVKCGTYLVRHSVPVGGVYMTGTVSAYNADVALLAARQYHDNNAPFPAAQAPGPMVDALDTGGVGTGAEFIPENGFVDMTFPTCTSATAPSLLGDGVMVLEGVVPVVGSPNGCGWDPTGRVYAIFKDQYATYSADAGGAGNPGWVVDADAAWSASYSDLSYDTATETLTLTFAGVAIPTYTTAVGGLGFGGSFWVQSVGKQMSGMTYLPLRKMGSHLPASSLVGADNMSTDPLVAGDTLAAGFHKISMGNRNGNMINPYSDAGYTADLSYVWTAAGDLTTAVLDAAGDTILPTPSVADDLVVGVPLPEDNTEFYEQFRRPVYGRIYNPDPVAGAATDPVAGVATYLKLNVWSDARWKTIHFGDAPGPFSIYDAAGIIITPSLNALMPCDRITACSDINPDGAVGDPGYFALAGAFLEPSFPRPVQNIDTAIPKVVAKDYAGLTVDQIGARDYQAFGGATLYEPVLAVFRRIRRWHKAQVDVIDLVEPLRFVYETRKGEVGAYDNANRILTADTALLGTATNLGAFTDQDVNIHTGDVVRIVDENGTVLDTAEIQRITSSTTVVLRRPGFTSDAFLTAPADYAFEVYLEQAIVPHEQSNEQLLALLTQEVVYTRKVSYTGPATPADDGGEVILVNEMRDSGITDWDLEGVQEDDYLVVDPSGPLYVTTEQGARAQGDMSVPARLAAPAGPYIAGGPSKLDDNRGFYKITAVGQGDAGADPAVLMVSGLSRFTDGEIFGDTGAEYVVMPTIDGSHLTADNLEGQQDLRLTALPDGLSYLDRTPGDEQDVYKSIGPFGYRIIRPNNIFSTDTVELILFIRERMLSWVEEINTILPKGGDYYVFQEKKHIEDVGSATDPTAGLGILSNLVVDSLKGLTGVQPFANMSDCLSVLDRRFWCLDFRLDNDGYTQFATGDYFQRPVLPDMIDGVLNTDDLFRSQRFGWITFRTNREDGSIRVARREDSTLGTRLRKQRAALQRQKAFKDS